VRGDVVLEQAEVALAAAGRELWMPVDPAAHVLLDRDPAALGRDPLAAGLVGELLRERDLGVRLRREGARRACWPVAWS
jgi:hypothetical protein